MAKKNDKSGIYAIQQAGTDRFYIGSSRQIYGRWRGHRLILRKGTHHAAFLQNAWTKHGEDAFEFYVLEECAVDELLTKEQWYIDAFKPAFNICPLARSRRGSKQSAETLAKMRAYQQARAALVTHCPKGHEYTETNTYRNKKGSRFCRACNALRVSAIYASQTAEESEAYRLAQAARYLRRRGPEVADSGSKEHFTKRAAALRGYVHSDQTRANMSKAAKVAAQTPGRMGKLWAGRAAYMAAHGSPSKGKSPSAETRQKIRDALKARTTHCVHGHLYDSENTKLDKNGIRNCRTCRKHAAAVRLQNEAPERRARRLELKRLYRQKKAA